jgi:NADH-quinone oxidoreductase subunit J
VQALVNPVWFYILLAVGGLGVALALPRPKVSPQLLGALIAAIGFGGVFLALGIKAYQNEQTPPLFFYVFALIGLGSALRVITHPRPVYAALYFILTILASSALYLLMQAEFMAFALIIIYAGAILITYLFVIMLATQAPSEDQVEALSEYDRVSREPVVATAVGFILLAVLSTMLARGVNEAMPVQSDRNSDALLAHMPKKVLRGLDEAGLFRSGFERPTVAQLGETLPEGGLRFNAQKRLVWLTVADEAAVRKALDDSVFAELFVQRDAMEKEEFVDAVEAYKGQVQNGAILPVSLPDRLEATNIDRVGWALIARHPMALELAGVILLMAMLGAVVLARKQIELSEAEKVQQARTLASGGDGPPGGTF